MVNILIYSPMFKQIILDMKTNLFDELSTSTKFEDITKGRKGVVLVQCNNSIPIIRTTTKYENPVQKFLPIHNELINNIKKEFKDDEL